MAALFEFGGVDAASFLADAAIKLDMADASFGEPSGEVVQRIVEGAEHDDLLLAGQYFLDEGEGAGHLGNVRLAAAVRQRDFAGAVAEGTILAGRLPGRASRSV